MIEYPTLEKRRAAAKLKSMHAEIRKLRAERDSLAQTQKHAKSLLGVTDDPDKQELMVQVCSDLRRDKHNINNRITRLNKQLDTL